LPKCEGATQGCEGADDWIQKIHRRKGN
jgi:hypothetical protein